MASQKGIDIFVLGFAKGFAVQGVASVHFFNANLFQLFFIVCKEFFQLCKLLLNVFVCDRLRIFFHIVVRFQKVIQLFFQHVFGDAPRRVAF